MQVCAIEATDSIRGELIEIIHGLFLVRIQVCRLLCNLHRNRYIERMIQENTISLRHNENSVIDHPFRIIQI